ncbi:hypothetical protein B4088_6371 [Bacillus cereus]|uniref:Uncharacterized protein n=1 Tax=Bacillus cereus TaxID=1396 RepID=A0A164KF90_BACCE|nr:hypothetical protein B4088_6371 [Bacillus cereus]
MAIMYAYDQNKTFDAINPRIEMREPATILKIAYLAIVLGIMAIITPYKAVSIKAPPFL